MTDIRVEQTTVSVHTGGDFHSYDVELMVGVENEKGIGVSIT